MVSNPTTLLFSFLLVRLFPLHTQQMVRVQVLIVRSDVEDTIGDGWRRSDRTVHHSHAPAPQLLTNLGVEGI